MNRRIGVFLCLFWSVFPLAFGSCGQQTDGKGAPETLEVEREAGGRVPGFRKRGKGDGIS